MRKMFLLFSHQITESQIVDAKKSLNVKEFIELPTQLQKLWSDIPADLKSLDDYFRPLQKYLLNNASQHDVILIQGDFGGTHTMVEFCKENQLVPVYATTKREVKELMQDNKIIKTSIFEHVIFREY